MAEMLIVMESIQVCSSQRSFRKEERRNWIEKEWC